MGSPVLLEFANAKMKRLVRTARHAAASSAPVLITGEKGTGRSVLAAAIHAWSPRRDREFIAVSCARLVDSSFQSELAAKLDDALAGTVFLEEIGDLPWALQTKLGAALKRRAERAADAPDLVGARIVAATHHDLEAQATVGAFRADLLHLVNVVSISIPPLRERPEDLRLLARHILRSHAELLGCAAADLTPQALAGLAAYEWPGNVRELVNVLDQAALVCGGNRIGVEDLPECVRALPSADTPDGYYERTLPLRAVERQHIERVIATSATLRSAASRLGIALTTLWRKRKRYGI
jgi:two-component system, NtrC family, response regulator AlgB